MPTMPRADEYQAAVQNPSTSFADPELRTARVETDILGLPRVASGGFALTYRLRSGNQNWAVRCFYKDVPDLQRRYQAISAFLQTNRGTMFVPVEYQSNGIRLGGHSYPIIKMPWVGGDPIGVYVESNLGDPGKLQPLPEAFRAIIGRLRQLAVAHGDLQHGNIMIEQGQLRLIDYDGFYVPALRGMLSGNLGHLNYQHPRRQLSDFGPDLDNFSSLVMYLGLRATVLQPSLWRTYATGENFLFTHADFVDPDHSRLFADLRLIPELRSLADSFRRVCVLPFVDVPTLEGFLQGRVAQPSTSPTMVPIAMRQQYPRIDTSDLQSLVRHLGQRVEVVGTITEVTWKSTYRGSRPFVFMSFGDWRQNCFRIVVWEDALQEFIKAGVDPNTFAHKRVSVTGVVTVYRGIPQIVVSLPSEIHILPSLGSMIATETLPPPSTVPWVTQPPPRSTPAAPASSRGDTDDVLNHLYKWYPPAPAAGTPPPPTVPQRPTPTSPPTLRPPPPPKPSSLPLPAKQPPPPPMFGLPSQKKANGQDKTWLEWLLEWLF